MTGLRADAPGWRTTLRQPGVAAALGAALLFGAGTPLAKLLLHSVNPWLLAGLLYLGSGLGLWLYRRLTGAPKVHLTRAELPWLAAAIGCGGVAAPVLLMPGLTRMPASGASLLNAEGVFTALLAWFAFGENVDRRVAWGMVLIVAGALILGWPGEARFSGVWPALAVAGGLPVLGPGQQPDAQGGAGRCQLDRLGQGAGGCTGQSGAGWRMHGRRRLAASDRAARA